MANPISIDLPHKLGAAEARRRLERGMGRLPSYLPGGTGQVEQAWNGDRLDLKVTAMGQEVRATLDVREALVHVEVLLPPALSFFGGMVEALLRREGGRLLEDKAKG